VIQASKETSEGSPFSGIEKREFAGDISILSWFGRTWNIALEPCTSWPATGLADQMAKGTAAKIRGNRSIELEMKAIAYTGLQGVKWISSEGRVEG